MMARTLALPCLPALLLLLSALLALLDPSVAGHVRVRRIVGGRAAAPPPEDDPVVFVYKDDHDARVLGTRERPAGFYTYRGLRYAEPPVGLYRFQVGRGAGTLVLRSQITAQRSLYTPAITAPKQISFPL